MTEALKIMGYGMTGTFLFAGFIYLTMVVLTKYVKDKDTE